MDSVTELNFSSIWGKLERTSEILTLIRELECQNPTQKPKWVGFVFSGHISSPFLNYWDIFEIGENVTFLSSSTASHLGCQPPFRIPRPPHKERGGDTDTPPVLRTMAIVCNACDWLVDVFNFYSYHCLITKQGNSDIAKWYQKRAVK